MVDGFYHIEFNMLCIEINYPVVILFDTTQVQAYL